VQRACACVFLSLTTTLRLSLPALQSTCPVPSTPLTFPAEPGQSTCPVDTSGPGLREQRACVPCPPGYSTKGLTGKTTSRDCCKHTGWLFVACSLAHHATVAHTLQPLTAA
jgi:hypothetical protein